MFTPLVHITLPEGDGEDRHFALIVIALKMMIAINVWKMKRALHLAQTGRGDPIPPLYASGVFYREDPPGQENWGDCGYVLQLGHGDCDRLVAYRCAELEVAGIPAEPVLKWQLMPRWFCIQTMKMDPRNVPPEGIWMVHCLVRYLDNNSIEDPSKILGMGGEYTGSV